MEFTVNADLEKHINTPLQKAQSAVEITLEDENEVDEAEDKDGDPITNPTRDAIYVHLAGNNQADNNIDPKKIIGVKNMTEGEGKSYLEVLKSRRVVNFSRSIAKRVISTAVSKLSHPRDNITAELASMDESVVDEIANSMGWVMGYLGQFRGYIMLGVYIGSSWLKDWGNPMTQFTEEESVKKLRAAQTEKNDNTKTSKVGDNATATIQSDGSE